jgi:hypothetical protein
MTSGIEVKCTKTLNGWIGISVARSSKYVGGDRHHSSTSLSGEGFDAGEIALQMQTLAWRTFWCGGDWVIATMLHNFARRLLKNSLFLTEMAIKIELFL